MHKVHKSIQSWEFTVLDIQCVGLDVVFAASGALSQTGYLF